MKFKIISALFFMVSLACSGGFVQDLKDAEQKLDATVTKMTQGVKEIKTEHKKIETSVGKIAASAKSLEEQAEKDLEAATGVIPKDVGEYVVIAALGADQIAREKAIKNQRNLIEFALKIKTQPLAAKDDFFISADVNEDVTKVGRWFRHVDNRPHQPDYFYIDGVRSVLKINLDDGITRVFRGCQVRRSVVGTEVASLKEVGILEELFSVKTQKGRSDVANLAIKSRNPFLNDIAHLGQASKVVGSWIQLKENNLHYIYINGYHGVLRVNLAGEIAENNRFHYKIGFANLPGHNDVAWKFSKPFVNLEKFKSETQDLLKGSDYPIANTAGQTNLIKLAIRKKDKVATPNLLARSRPDKAVAPDNRMAQGHYMLIGKYAEVVHNVSKYVVVSGYDGLLVIKKNNAGALEVVKLRNRQANLENLADFGGVVPATVFDHDLTGAHVINTINLEPVLPNIPADLLNQMFNLG